MIVELKAVSEIHEEHVRQCINYRKGGGRKLGLLVNFGPYRVDTRRVINCDAGELD